MQSFCVLDVRLNVAALPEGIAAKKGIENEAKKIINFECDF